MKALVVGGAGFIGSHLVDRLLAGGETVDVVDDLSAGSLGNLADARSAGGTLKIHHLDVGTAESRPYLLTSPYPLTSLTLGHLEKTPVLPGRIALSGVRPKKEAQYIVLFGLDSPVNKAHIWRPVTSDRPPRVHPSIRQEQASTSGIVGASHVQLHGFSRV